jgi:hypothetical protein
MTSNRFEYPIVPMPLQNMRENAVRSLTVECHQGLSAGTINAFCMCWICEAA